jgi:RNA polymerase sigma-70 factor (ECF subfamily)
VEGYEHQEIAKILDCSVGNSKSQLHKAKLRIREFLAEPGRAGIEAQEAAAQETASRQRKNPRSELGFAEAV